MRRRIPTLLFLASLAVLPACDSGDAEREAVPPDSMTQRQRDSVIGESRLPGAQGVRGALDASDAADARAAALDSVSGGR